MNFRKTACHSKIIKHCCGAMEMQDQPDSVEVTHGVDEHYVNAAVRKSAALQQELDAGLLLVEKAGRLIREITSAPPGTVPDFTRLQQLVHEALPEVAKPPDPVMRRRSVRRAV